MADVERGLWRSPGPTPCSVRDTSSQLPSTVSRRLWNLSKVVDFTISLSNCASAWSSSVKLCFLKLRVVLVYAHCLHWTGKSPLCTLFPGIYIQQWDWGRPRGAFLFSRVNSPSSLSPHRRDIPAPSSFLWPCVGLSPLHPYLSCIGEWYLKKQKNSPQSIILLVS